MRVFLSGLVAVAALTLTPFAVADRVYHSQHIPLVPVTATSPGGGFVENTHANGPVNYAHEIYILHGARPNTTYSVTLRIYGDSNCSGVIASLTTARFMTNRAGNGEGDAKISPAEADGLRGHTLYVQWTVTSGTSTYRTACSQVVLD
jgi:hypothetical protein